MEFTMEKAVILMRALEEYADFLGGRAEDPDENLPEYWYNQVDQARTLLKRIEDTPASAVTG